MHAPLLKLAALMEGHSRPWCICGGWAIDLFVGMEDGARRHKDIDLAVFRQDQLCIQQHLLATGWALQVACEGLLRLWEPRERLELPLHEIWCRRENHGPDAFELLLNEREGDEYVHRRDSTIRLPMSMAIVRSRSGLPLLAPEIVCLYKSTAPHVEVNALDFQVVWPHLGPARWAWLKSILQQRFPQHPWLPALRARS